MTRFYAFIIFTFFTTFASAQEYLNFDEWSDDITPIGWRAELNSFAPFLGDTSLVQTEGYAGLAVECKPIDLSILGVPAAASLLQYGDDGRGMPIDYFPLSVDLYHWFQDESTGIAEIGIALTRLNEDTGEIDTLASMFSNGIERSDDWVLASYDIVKNELGNSGPSPDSIKIAFGALTPDLEVFESTSFKVDELVFSVPTSTTDLENKVEVKVYPTLVSSNVNFEFEGDRERTVMIYDAMGKLITKHFFNQTRETLNLAFYNAGTYVYQVYEDGFFVNTGKFVKQ